MVFLAGLTGVHAEADGSSYHADFEAPDFSPGSIDGQHGWWVDQGSATVLPGMGLNGSSSLSVSAGEPFSQARLSLLRPPGSGPVLFLDAWVLLPAGGSLVFDESFDMDSARIGLFRSSTVSQAAGWHVFHGDGAGGGDWLDTGVIATVEPITGSDGVTPPVTSTYNRAGFLDTRTDASGTTTMVYRFDGTALAENTVNSSGIPKQLRRTIAANGRQTTLESSWGSALGVSPSSSGSGTVSPSVNYFYGTADRLSSISSGGFTGSLVRTATQESLLVAPPVSYSAAVNYSAYTSITRNSAGQPSSHAAYYTPSYYGAHQDGECGLDAATRANMASTPTRANRGVPVSRWPAGQYPARRNP